MENILPTPKKNKLIQDSEGNDESIPSSRLQQNKDNICQGTQLSPQEHPERSNPASNH
jgi:hypothetical protein